MRAFVLLCACVPLAAGCGQKAPKFTGASDDPSVARTAPPVGAGDKTKAGPSASPGDKTKGKGDEKPNWLTDPRFKKDGQLPADKPVGLAPLNPGAVVPVNPMATPLPAVPGTLPPPPGGVTPMPGVLPLGPQPGPQPGLPPGMVPSVPAQPPAPVQPPTGTAAKAVTEADMKDVWLYIENASQATGKMPPPGAIYAALVEAKSPAAELLKDGSIVLTGARTRETAIWAAERTAPTQGGLIAGPNGVENLKASEVVARLRR